MNTSRTQRSEKSVMFEVVALIFERIERFIFNQEIPRSLLRGYLAKGRGGRNRGVSPTMPFRLIPRSLLRGGFIRLQTHFISMPWKKRKKNQMVVQTLHFIVV